MKYIDTNKAIEICKAAGVDTSKPTIIKWIQKYELGKKIAGRWVIDPDKLKKMLKGHHSADTYKKRK